MGEVGGPRRGGFPCHNRKRRVALFSRAHVLHHQSDGLTQTVVSKDEESGKAGGVEWRTRTGMGEGEKWDGPGRVNWMIRPQQRGLSKVCMVGGLHATPCLHVSSLYLRGMRLLISMRYHLHGNREIRACTLDCGIVLIFLGHRTSDI